MTKISSTAKAIFAVLEEQSNVDADSIANAAFERRYPNALRRASALYQRYKFEYTPAGWMAHGPGLPSHGPYGSVEIVCHNVLTDTLRVMSGYSREIAECNARGDYDGVLAVILTIEKLTGER